MREELGGLDARFFVYAEDADPELRAIRAGYRPVFTPEAEITHAGCGSPTQPERLIRSCRAR